MNKYLSLTILVLILLAYPVAQTAAHDANPKSWTGTVRGEVMKTDGKVFIVQDSLDRTVLLEVGPNCTVDEPIQVGDEIVAHVVHQGKEKYIKSLKRLISSPIISSSPTGISAVVEGEVLKIDRETYVIQDTAGTWKPETFLVDPGTEITLMAAARAKALALPLPHTPIPGGLIIAGAKREVRAGLIRSRTTL